MITDTINDAVTMAGGAGALLANRYRVVRQLGQGGMGSVWLAEDTQLDNKLFAIKMLPSILVSNKRAYRQLKDEALVAMQLVHPNIVQIRAFEENSGNPFLVMDYIDGQTLDDYLAEHTGTMGVSPVGHGSTGTTGILPVGHGGTGTTGVSPVDVLRILRPIAAALDYAHAKGVVHRDVKPGNVMIAKDGTPYILDFGIAREIQETMTRVTGKLFSGTLLYMSPEQLMGESPKPAQDIYSFAAMAYECLKGEPPFARGAIEDQIKNKQPEPPPGGTQLVASVMSGLAKNFEDRPPTCSAVLEGNGLSRVEHVERVETVGARVPRARTGGSRSRATVGIFAAAALALAAVGGWWYYRQEQAREQARIAVEAARQKTAAEEAKRKAEEAARQKAAAEEAERKAEEAARQKAAAEEAERIAKASATEIRIEARVQQSAVRNISDEDGFRAKKDKLDKEFARADALFDDKVKRWSAAAVLFTNYVAECKALLTLDGERRTAMGARTKAGEAKDGAEKAEAERYAPTRWNEAIRLLDSANADFAGMQFADAERSFASASKQFGICMTDAKAEKKRREDAAVAQAKAEKEARERAEAEARERAEREARERERRAKWRKEGEEFTINDPYGLYMTMKWCPATTSDEWKRISGGKEYFTMGSPMSEEGRDDDEKQHEVTLTRGFWMGQTEVTQGQWKKIMDGETVVDLARKGLQDDTLYDFPGGKKTLREFWGMERDGDPRNRCGDLKDDVPVYNVSWNEAVEFCRRLTRQERAAGRIPDGYEYRLPTEAEWEYACRAGSTTALPNNRDIRIRGANNAPMLDNIAWYGGNSSVGFEGRGVDTSGWPEKQFPGGRAFARAVKGKNTNDWGLYDMIGNVWEWCGDWFGPYPSGSATDPTGPVRGASRVNRGGSWYLVARSCRSAYRDRDEPGYRNFNLGFRVAFAPSH